MAKIDNIDMQVKQIVLDDMVVIFFELYENDAHLDERLYSVTVIDAHRTPTAEILTRSQLNILLSDCGNSLDELSLHMQNLAKTTSSSAPLDAATEMSGYVK